MSFLLGFAGGLIIGVLLMILWAYDAMSEEFKQPPDEHEDHYV